MSDLRFDPVSGHWVSIATNRNDRPFEYVPSEQIVKRPLCPFCAGNESETPAELMVYNAAGESVDHADDSWLVRVVPNKYPSFSMASESGQPKTQSVEFTPGSAYRSGTDHGIQELIIPTSRHMVSIGDLTEQEATVGMQACQQRIAAIRSGGQMQHAMLFTNCRSAAGASLEHIHSQLIASPIQSAALESRCRRNVEHSNEHGKLLLESIVQWELEKGDRIIEQTEHFTVLCPYASRFAFQTWIVPTRHGPYFDQIDSEVTADLTQLVQRQVQRLEATLDQPAYNVLYHIPPFDQSEGNPWFVEIFPRLTTPAGFELGTDIWINPVAPETASRRLCQARKV